MQTGCDQRVRAEGGCEGNHHGWVRGTAPRQWSVHRDPRIGVPESLTADLWKGDSKRIGGKRSQPADSPSLDCPLDPRCNLDGRENASQKKEGIQRGPREEAVHKDGHASRIWVWPDVVSFFSCLWPSHNRSLPTCRIPGHFNFDQNHPWSLSTPLGHLSSSLPTTTRLDLTTQSPASTSHHLTSQPKKEDVSHPQIPPVTPKQPRSRRRVAHKSPQPSTHRPSPAVATHHLRFPTRKTIPTDGIPRLSFAPAPQKQQG